MNAQLYVVSGAPTPNDLRKYAITLAQILPDGTIGHLKELFPKSTGAEWIGFSYDRQEALIFGGDQNSAVVLDLDAARVAKTCALPTVEGAYLMTQYLADSPGRGLTFEWILSGPPAVGTHVLGMVLNPEISCDASFVAVAHSDAAVVVASGTAGVADIRSPEGVAAAVKSDGTLVTSVLADDQTGWGDKVPVGFIRGIEKPLIATRILINNSEMLVIHIATGKKEALYLAMRKRDKTWHVIQAHTDEWDRMRGFGKFIAVTEARPKTERDRISANTIDMKMLLGMEAQQHMSAGVSEWRTLIQPDAGLSRESARGPDTVSSFNESNSIYPGRLWLFDIETDKMLPIETKQGDSEVLLIENGTVYYRVTNRIYSAEILTDRIGPPKLIVEDEVIRDVHYAFLKRGGL